jgi:large subunit ribosomal protein L1
MEKKEFIDAIKKLRESSVKRNFNQSIDLIINLKAIDLKKPEQKVDLFLVLPHTKGKEVKVCALVGNELATQAKGVFDKVILNDDFSKYNEKKILKKLASEYDFFIAQANLMAPIATTFGKTLGPRGKMPNPKAGCVVPGTAQLAPVKEKLQRTVHIQTKNETILKTGIGTEAMKDEDIAENAYFIYNAVVQALPQEKANLKSIILKTTMGVPILMTDNGPIIKEKKEKKKDEKVVHKDSKNQLKEAKKKESKPKKEKKEEVKESEE